jgi:hypothetical protein
LKRLKTSAIASTRAVRHRPKDRLTWRFNCENGARRLQLTVSQGPASSPFCSSNLLSRSVLRWRNLVSVAGKMARGFSGHRRVGPRNRRVCRRGRVGSPRDRCAARRASWSRASVAAWATRVRRPAPGVTRRVASDRDGGVAVGSRGLMCRTIVRPRRASG